MSTPVEAASASPVPDGSPRRRLRGFLRFALGFWRARAKVAWPLTLGVALFVVGNLAIQVGVNAWNRWFFDALERKDGQTVLLAALAYLVLAVATAASAVGLVRCRMSLQVRWREWLTKRLLGWWFSDQRYYRLGIVEGGTGNPEYRIADDVRLATEPVVEFGVGISYALLTAATFAGILFGVGGSYVVPLGGGVTVPGYMAVGAIGYASLVTLATYFVGKPMVRRVADKNEGEAQFRYELTRLRENAESIALLGGDRDEREGLERTYGEVVRRWFGVVRQHGRLTWILNGNGALAAVAPLLLAAPKYLDGQLSFGEVMQLQGAFVQVQLALNWLVDNYIRLAEWFASARRVDELCEALESLDEAALMADDSRITVEPSPDGRLHLEHLSVAHKSGTVVIADADVVIEPGQKVLLAGASGTGKSTLVRAIAGLWPWGTGRVLIPAGARIAFVPQKPYIPLGSLRAALVYPDAAGDVASDRIEAALRRCGLGYLVRRLDEEARWDATLSGGERQRVAFARLVLQRPDIVILDEATSALDEESQASLLTLLMDDLAGATVLSVGHRPGLEEFHDRKLVLERRASGARMSSKPLGTSLWRLFSEARDRAA